MEVDYCVNQGVRLNPSIKSTLHAQASAFFVLSSLKQALFDKSKKARFVPKWTFFVIPFGFEPKTYCLEGSCSIQLSYGTYFSIQLLVCRITRRQKLREQKKRGWLLIPYVGAAGFEPATSWSQTRRDDRTTLRPELIILISFIKPTVVGFSSLPTFTLLRWERDFLRRSSLRYGTNPAVSHPFQPSRCCGGSGIRTRGTVTRTTV